jgi:hypothetical protein
MKKRLNPDSEENIRRIDTKPKAKKQTHGFQVHVLRGDQTITRLFSDNRYGGKEGARRAARKFRRDTLGEMPARAGRGVSEAASRRSESAAGRKRPAASNRARKR